MKKFYGFVQNLVKSDYGMSINDVMNTDWNDLLAVINSSTEEKREEVVDLAEFVQTI